MPAKMIFRSEPLRNLVFSKAAAGSGLGIPCSNKKR
jgi:hypothetical protein